ncbi:MAG: MerR family transcriptional regulator [Flavobacterium sp.]|nr:MerR family transcriptional regulator [Flavobacterium sp.]
MDVVKNVFSIKDLENLSGIKAHTIRIWEKRYNILVPKRTDTNIRYYDLHCLQKLLNITLLHDFGYKISKISTYPEEQIPVLVNEIITKKTVKHHAISSFKMAMMNFDQVMFMKVYDQILGEKSFREVFNEILIPLMNEIGLLWQTDTISAAHEHFLTYLIKQKLILQTEKVQLMAPTKNDKVFILYLPSNEIHDLGLMYLNYEILSKGYKTIYLGESVPIDSLKDVKAYFDKIIFLSYLTVEPNKDEINNYVKTLKKEILNDEKTEIWLTGRILAHLDLKIINEKISLFYSIPDVVNKI